MPSVVELMRRVLEQHEHDWDSKGWVVGCRCGERRYPCSTRRDLEAAIHQVRSAPVSRRAADGRVWRRVLDAP